MWQSVVDPSGARLLVAFAIGEQGNRIFVVGPVDTFSALLVRSLDANTGAVLWEDRIDGGPNSSLDGKWRLPATWCSLPAGC